MKRNVDLTENRLFSNDNLLDERLVFGLIAEDKLPWNLFLYQMESDEDIKHQRDAVVIVGDKKTREEIKYRRKLDSLDYCDCCNARMNLKPWDKEIGICHKCDNYYSNNEDRCKWRKKEMIRNAVIR